LLARVILDEPVVLYRRADGAPVALEDRCCHRSVPLSIGTLMGDNLQCGYHGLMFDSAGDCVEVPGQAIVPPGAAVRSYPVADRHNLVWIWMGEASRADEADIPDLHWLDAPGWVAKPAYLHVKSGYRLIIENLLDTSHLTFVHKGTIGSAAIIDNPPKCERGDREVRVVRWMMDIEPSPTWQRLGYFDGNIDRCQISHWMVPASVTVDATKWVAGEGGPDADRAHALEVFNINTITPETATTSHYFWSQALGPLVNGDPDINEKFHDQIHEAFQEDQIILELQQSRIDQFGRSDHEIDINVDSGILQARRILDGLIAAENG
jgi:phenylpropionate dioxygenase-like ring-hydroxylating dioxygenase large terminal subunit